MAADSREYTQIQPKKYRVVEQDTKNLWKVEYHNGIWIMVYGGTILECETWIRLMEQGYIKQ
jgi:hypothetical protein